jgi:hypothetical protein
LKKQLWVDALGDFGENSRFEFSADTPYMLLGIGGIPDAEDADVIIHEYGHALAFYIAPNTIDGEERIGIDEANSDILTVIYSRKLSDYNWRKVFNWDGNQTWNGRTTLNNKNYIDDFIMERYSLSAIWSGAVTDIAEEIGLDTTTNLLLTAMASLQNNLTIPQFAELFIQADSILYKKYHYATIKNSFFNRKLIPSVSVEDIDNEQFVKIQNSQGFALNNESIVIQMPTSAPFNVSVLDIQGRTVFEMQNNIQTALLHPAQFQKGIYIVKINVGNKVFNYKITKF